MAKVDETVSEDEPELPSYESIGGAGSVDYHYSSSGDSGMGDSGMGDSGPEMHLDLLKDKREELEGAHKVSKGLMKEVTKNVKTMTKKGKTLNDELLTDANEIIQNHKYEDADAHLLHKAKSLLETVIKATRATMQVLEIGDVANDADLLSIKKEITDTLNIMATAVGKMANANETRVDEGQKLHNAFNVFKSDLFPRALAKANKILKSGKDDLKDVRKTIKEYSRVSSARACVCACVCVCVREERYRDR